MMNMAYWGLTETVMDLNAMKEFELKSKLHSIHLGITTNDLEVIRILRALIEPITLFGEGKYERRERLKKVLLFKYDRLFHGKDLNTAISTSSEAKNLYDVIKAFNIDMSNVFANKSIFGDLAQQDSVPDTGDKELFYTEGPEELKQFRSDLASHCWHRTITRKRYIHEYRDCTDQFEHEDDIDRYGNHLTESVTLAYSHLAAERPLTAAKFSPNMNYIAVSSFCSYVSLLHYHPENNLPLAKTLDNGSKEMLHCIDWAPGRCVIYHQDATPVDDKELLLATGGSGGSVTVWRPFATESASTVKTHDDRINRIKFHNFKNMVVTGSADETVRFFDTETMQEIYIQEGHSHGVHGLGINGDGNLVSSGDLHGVVLIIDIRTGKHIFQQPLHNGKVTSIEFHPVYNHLMATAAEDNSVKLFDLRKVRPATSLLAHTKLVSCIQFEPVYGRFLATASFDTHLKLWDAAEYKCRKVLSNNDAKVMGVNIAPDASSVVTACYDRTIRIFNTQLGNNPVGTPKMFHRDTIM
ncbi:WD domain G-beta repeat family protein [Babesia bovis T2Bo]|uniref:WD domain, G-beta repeat domain containing protein n=1 Tax=Babesia bovis TaxID=5865 RepID=A7AWL5_BABBO|nr:WD domain G-beta repeat family protein [Babesia bovis T2Bo]EDO05443.1 WD domain G-beta repeat family protein [Babesia bovis T2Bo]|eukprot:XP_001609011.1 WD domain, G-beta repeat domain containing protein [Babesia bovis T2Bo]